jgi:hypothetical protein
MRPAYMEELCEHEASAEDLARVIRRLPRRDVHLQTRAIDDEFGWGDAQVVSF